jgi:hypothetical protein
MSLKEYWITVCYTTWQEPLINMTDDAWDRDRHFLANAQVQCFAEDRMTQVRFKPTHQNLIGIKLEIVPVKLIHTSSYHLQ